MTDIVSGGALNSTHSPIPDRYDCGFHSKWGVCGYGKFILRIFLDQRRCRYYILSATFCALFNVAGRSDGAQCISSLSTQVYHDITVSTYLVISAAHNFLTRGCAVSLSLL